ncbi:glutamyl-tRNA reductase-binding protein, chloroplastic [Senna tora]|uniref:Glutamyl-tRNA reductase-binding protein, chloroplastic n=1 Tax=Senna tora TaxID=362788 RepID=A0A834XEJ2_9FABA|nr:glutamyl-tRNA reductase-binding protein, chloroplastic [Senna tora]
METQYEDEEEDARLIICSHLCMAQNEKAGNYFGGKKVGRRKKLDGAVCTNLLMLPPPFLEVEATMTQSHLAPSFTPSKPLKETQFSAFNSPKRVSFRNFAFKTLKCSLSTLSEPSQLELKSNNKPLPAEVSRTIMELATVGTLSTLSQEGQPLGIGVRFAVDSEGTPMLSLNAANKNFSFDARSSLHVQLTQSGLRTPQCTLQGSLNKPEDRVLMKRLNSLWKKRFGEDVNEDFIYIVAVEKVLQMEDFQEDGVWVTSLDYKNAQPDPLRDCAENLVDEINTNNMEDITRFCNVYVDLDFQVLEAKMIWVDRLGFDMRLCSCEKGIFEVRIPFPREVTDEKGAKSTFNCMSQMAWEVEKNFNAPDFEKVKHLKHIKS